jgi:hypothetical protein
VFPRDRKEISNPLIERTCRITLDVRVLVNEITRENVAGTFIPNETDENGLTWEWAERQNRLLLMIIQDEETLNEFLIDITMEDLKGILNIKPTRPGNSKELDVIERLALRTKGKDKLFFQEAIDKGVFWDNAQLVDEAFWHEWVRAEIREIRVIKQDTAL